MPATAKTPKAPKAAKPPSKARILANAEPRAFPKLMNVPDAAKVLGVSTSHIYRLMGDGSLSYLVIGKLRKISEQDVWVYLRRARRNVETAEAIAEEKRKAAKAKASSVAPPPPDPKQPDLPHHERRQRTRAAAAPDVIDVVFEDLVEGPELEHAQA